MDYPEFAAKFHLTLNGQQARAVQSGGRAVLLLAVPGSGKTTTLVARLGYLLYCRGAAPEQLLTVTYTVAASRDMKARFRALFGDEYADRLDFRTINSLSAAIIRRCARLTGREPFALSEQSDALLARAAQRVRGDWPDEGELRDLRQAVTYLKNMRLGRAELEALEAGGGPVAPVYDAYQADLRARREMDYDDQLVFARSILLRCPALRAALQARYRFLCVDEAQDNSRIQHELLHLLTGAGSRLFLVGDEDQSIYGFRAADPEALLRFERDYPGAEVLLLEKNYRSTPEITSLAGRFIARNTLRRAKTMEAVRPGGAAVRAVDLPGRAAQYDWLCALAREDRETAVLFRNNDSAVPLIDRLDRDGIPFRCRAGEWTFFESRTVSGVRDILTLSLDPRAGAAFLRVYWKFSLPVRREHAAAALERCRTAPDLGLLRALYETVRDASAPGDTLPPRLLALERTVAGLRDLPTREALARIRCESGFGAWLLKEGGDPERLWLLDQLAARERTPAGFLARLARLGDLLRTGGDPGCPFVLSTIHSSKGLEYARVVVMDAVDGILPSSPPPAQVRDPAERPAALRAYEEERRLFYVAVTRAKDELLLLRYGAETPSSFLTQFLPEAPAPQRTPAAAPRAALTPAEAAALETALRTPGARLIHKTFGPGALQSVTGRLAQIAFDDGQARTLDLAFCQARGMLKAEP